jgi:hypothetical protein
VNPRNPEKLDPGPEDEFALEFAIAACENVSRGGGDRNFQELPNSLPALCPYSALPMTCMTTFQDTITSAYSLNVDAKNIITQKNYSVRQNFMMDRMDASLDDPVRGKAELCCVRILALRLRSIWGRRNPLCGVTRHFYGPCWRFDINTSINSCGHLPG